MLSTHEDYQNFITEFEGVYRIFKGLIYKYEDVVNELDPNPGDDILLTLEKIRERLHRIKDRSGTE